MAYDQQSGLNSVRQLSPSLLDDAMQLDQQLSEVRFWAACGPQRQFQAQSRWPEIVPGALSQDSHKLVPELRLRVHLRERGLPGAERSADAAKALLRASAGQGQLRHRGDGGHQRRRGLAGQLSLPGCSPGNHQNRRTTALQRSKRSAVKRVISHDGCGLPGTAAERRWRHRAGEEQHGGVGLLARDLHRVGVRSSTESVCHRLLIRRLLWGHCRRSSPQAARHSHRTRNTVQSLSACFP